MKYVSIDVETTGLDVKNDQVLEFAAVIEDTLDPKPIGELPFFRAFLLHDRVAGHPFAMAMNQRCLQIIAEKREGPWRLLTPEQLAAYFRRFVCDNGLEKIVVAGKNYGSFDSQILRNTVPGWSKLPIHHRFIDPAMLYFRPTDDFPPSMGECVKRAGIVPFGSLHNALADARTVVQLVRAKLKEQLC